MNKIKNIGMRILEYVYIISAISPILIIFLIKNYYYILTSFIFILACIFSNLYIYLKIKTEKDSQDEKSGDCSLIEIAEPKFMPIYIAYFVISLSIDTGNWGTFWIIYFIIFLLILRCKFIFFNPFVLWKWSFYEAEIQNKNNINCEVTIKNNNSANYKIFIISKNDIKNIGKISNLIRLNNFTFLQKDINE